MGFREDSWAYCFVVLLQGIEGLKPFQWAYLFRASEVSGSAKTNCLASGLRVNL